MGWDIVESVSLLLDQAEGKCELQLLLFFRSQFIDIMDGTFMPWSTCAFTERR